MKTRRADREAAREAAAAEADSFEQTEFSNAAKATNEAARALREALESFSHHESLDDASVVAAETTRGDATNILASRLVDRAADALAAAEAAAAARAARAAVSARESGALRSAPEHSPEPHARSVDETHLAARAERSVDETLAAFCALACCWCACCGFRGSTSIACCAWPAGSQFIT